MSLYPQHHYGQPSYPISYPQLGSHSGYYQPPPAPVYHIDAATFRRDYAGRLAELNVNSRPIIQNLSMLAQEFSRFAEIVAQCLEAHIRRVSFFLLDHLSSCAPWV
jgi:pre-mRNA cleavage complex 2 protein Pcf11